MAFRDEVVDGTNMILSVGGTALGCSSSCSVEINRNTRDTGNKDSGIWDTFAAGNMNWAMSSENFVNFAGLNGFSEMYDAQEAGSPVTVSCVYDEDGLGVNSFTLSGDAIITNLPISAPKGDNISFSISFQGTGKLTKTVVKGA